jgi:hypothetical protein
MILNQLGIAETIVTATYIALAQGSDLTRRREPTGHC